MKIIDNLENYLRITIGRRLVAALCTHKQQRVLEKLEPLCYIGCIQRARVDLNHRPTEPESVALSPEPRALMRNHLYFYLLYSLV